MVNLVYTNVKGDTFGITLIPDKPFNVLSGDILQLDVSPDNVFQNGADLFIMVDGAIYILRNFFENSSVTEGPQTSIWYDGSQYFATDFQTTIQPEFVRYEIADFAGLPFSNFANNTPLPSFQTVNFFNDQTPDLINSIIAVDSIIKSSAIVINDTFSITEDTSFLFNPTVNDFHPLGVLFNIVSLNTSGLLGNITNFGGNLLFFSPGGALDFLPAGALGTTSFKYTVSTIFGATSTGTVNFNVIGVNDAPVLSGSNDLSSIEEDPTTNTGTAIADLISGNITDPDLLSMQGIAITGVDNTDGQWQYSINGGGTWTDINTVSDTNALLLTDNPMNLVRFMSDLNFNGSKSLDFRAWDQTSGTNDTFTDVSTNGGTTAYSATTSTSTITITPVNDAPMITAPATAMGSEDTSFAIPSLAIADVDANDTPGATLTVDLSVSNGTLTIGTTTGLSFTGLNGTNSFSIEGSITDINTALGTLSYLGDMDFNGSDTLVIDVDDQGNTGSGGALTDTATVAITVNPVDDPLIANDDTATTDEDTLVSIPVLANDMDVDNTFSLTAVMDPALGTVSINGSNIDYNPSGALDSLDVGETSLQSFTYTITNDIGVTAMATVTVTVTGVEDPLIANDDTTTTDEDTIVSIPVLTNDVDLDDGFSITGVTAPAAGTVSINGANIDYDPSGALDSLDVGETSIQSFSYTITNDDGTTDTATVTVTVTGVEDP
ncbi:MAG: hypothetical protein CMF50_00180, partial [Legionellales bacterium]|nr:hypothetical protein [Legionellales bacterium]